MPSDVLYTHFNALIFQNNNGRGGPITYQIIILYRQAPPLCCQRFLSCFHLSIVVFEYKEKQGATRKDNMETRPY